MKRFSHAAACFICLMISFCSYAQTISDEAEIKKEVKKSFVKMLVDKIRFTKNAREKEKQRILTLVESLGLKDSIASNANNIKLIIHELEKKENQHFDSLKQIISKIALSTPLLPDEAPSGENSAMPGSLSDKDLETLASQIMPLLKAKDAGDKEEKEKQAVLKKLKEIRNTKGVIHLQKVTDSVIKRYKVDLENRTELFGFYDGDGHSIPAAPVLQSFNSLIYHSLTVNDTTGDIINKASLHISPVISAARAAGCDVYFAIQLQNKESRSSFLYNTNVWQKCIDSLLELLQKRNANGILLSCKNMRKQDRRSFTGFVRLAYHVFKQRNTSLKLFVTLPRAHLAGAYDVPALDEVTDKFFIDFATNTDAVCGPLAPLKGNRQNTIESAFAWYEAQGVKAEKMVLILPYRGTGWQTRNASQKQDIFTGYLNVSEIESKYGQAAFYDDETASLYIDTIYANNRAGRIWYDNEITLGEKYDYILENGLGGAAVFCMNYDEGLKALRDELTYKFAVADTTHLPDSVIRSVAGLSFWQKAGRYFSLYKYILQNPCATCFEKTPNSGQDILNYLVELKIDSLVRAKKNTSGNDGPATASLKEQYSYINSQLTNALLYVTLFLLLVSVGLICVYVAGLRYNGDDWPVKKRVAFILILSSALFVLAAFTWCFTSDRIPLFGVSGRVARNPMCVHDADCINIPFRTLLLIIISGIVIGFILFRGLITPLLKRKDVP